MMRTTCSACGSTDLELFLDLGMSPVADAYLIRADEESPRYPLQVAVCGKCRLAQLLEILDEQLLFGTGYSFYSSASAPLSSYHAQYARNLIHHYDRLLMRGVVEIGCNDGDMLRHFSAYPSIGVDPAEGPAGVAQRDRGLEVMVQPFGLAVAHEIRDRRGHQGVIIANHVLAHVADVGDVLAGIQALLSPVGIAWIEVQYLPDMLVNNAFDLVYHEHRNFFSLSSLEQAAHRYGLAVTHAELTDRQGGSLRVALRPRASLKAPQEWPFVARIRASETWLEDASAYASMQGRAERIRARLQDMLSERHGARGTRIVGYGAPAKATTLINFCDIGDRLSFVVDTTPAKQGRYIPGDTPVRILSPQELDHEHSEFDDTALILAWNYARTIMRNNADFRGNWIVPIPSPVLL